MSDRPRDDARSLVGRLYDTYGASLYRYAVLLLADAAAVADFEGDRARDDVARGEVLGRWRIALHEALALGKVTHVSSNETVPKPHPDDAGRVFGSR